MSLITVAPAAKILDASENTVRKLARRGDLQVTLTESGIRLFEREAVERLAAERKARLAAREQK
jgi:predicted site-specific integrase-resolvase